MGARRAWPEPAELARLYAELGTGTALAAHLGRSAAAVYARLRRAGVQMGPCGKRRTVARDSACQPKGVRSGRWAPSGSEPTPREVEILALAAIGCSNREIGATLDVTEDTVKTHLRRLLYRLDARDWTHAVVIALSRGLLVLDGSAGGSVRVVV